MVVDEVTISDSSGLLSNPASTKHTRIGGKSYAKGMYQNPFITDCYIMVYFQMIAISTGKSQQNNHKSPTMGCLCGDFSQHFARGSLTESAFDSLQRYS